MLKLGLRKFTSASSESMYAVASTKVSLHHLFSTENQDLTQSFIQTVVPKYFSTKITGIQNFPITPIHVVPEVDYDPQARFLIESREVRKTIVEIDTSHLHGIGDLTFLKLCTSYVSQLTTPHPSVASNVKGIMPLISIQVHDYGDTTDRSDTEVHITEDDYIKNFTFQDLYSGDSIESLQILEIDLPRVRKYLIKRRSDYSSFSDMDWWLEILANSSKYNNFANLYLDYPVPTFFGMAMDKLNMNTWSSALRNSYLEEVCTLKAVKVYTKKQKHEGKHPKLEIFASKLKEDFAVKMLSMNYPVSNVATITGIPIDKVESLLKSLPFVR